MQQAGGVEPKKRKGDSHFMIRRLSTGAASLLSLTAITEIPYLRRLGRKDHTRTEISFKKLFTFLLHSQYLSHPYGKKKIIFFG